MPTTAERRALWFLAGALTLGAGVRAAQARRAEHAPSGASATALERQLAAVDSARLLRGHRNQTRAPREARGASAAPRIVGAFPSGRGATASGSATSVQAAVVLPPDERRFAPPLSRIEPVDVDRATETELLALKGIGPKLAGRIVADRATNGPFGSLAGLERVKGIGPGLTARLAPSLRFSGTATAEGASATKKKSARRRSDRVSSHVIDRP